jgi:hypothetical protein
MKRTMTVYATTDSFYSNWSPYWNSTRAAEAASLNASIMAYNPSSQSSHGQTVSPVPFVVSFQIVNTSDAPVKIRDLSVAVADHQGGPWQRLVPIEPWDQGYLIGETDPKEPIPLKKALPVKFEPMLADLLASAVPPHGEISGWAAFDVRRPCPLRLATHWRVTMHDNALRAFAVETEAPQGTEPDTIQFDEWTGFHATGPVTDLSGAFLKHLKDP